MSSITHSVSPHRRVSLVPDSDAFCALDTSVNEHVAVDLAVTVTVTLSADLLISACILCINGRTHSASANSVDLHLVQCTSSSTDLCSKVTVGLQTEHIC